ncbi:MAG TPA: dTDP-glucose 4,6-dehydratase [Acidobacteriota bacterium]|nr:dTDP-glucose 4,6-dehydratase [Acidobacteriota bacterium]
MDLDRYTRRIVVTGGAGFIGSNLLLYLVAKCPDYLFINVDCLTYAANLGNLASIENLPNYRFERIDIRDYPRIQDCFERYRVDSLIHLAAESHVDRSIIGPAPFIDTNIVGTFNLLEAARRRLGQTGSFRFHHVSTDEVFGSLGPEGYFSEQSAYGPNSPYSASKAAADHLVRAYHRTYGLDTVTTNCSNNYGPFQFPEKLIPLMIRNAGAGQPLPVYGDGEHVRDWLYVVDHCEALDLVFHRGETGQTYTIGGQCEIRNIDMVRRICRILDEKLGGGPREDLITLVKDRPGHDRRYAIDPSRVQRELGWTARVGLDEGLRRTVQWYVDNADWLQRCVSGEYRKYYDMMYSDR